MYPWIIVYAVITLFTIISFIWFVVCFIRAKMKHTKLSKKSFIALLIGMVLMIVFWNKFRADVVKWLGLIITDDTKVDPVPPPVMTTVLWNKFK